MDESKTRRKSLDPEKLHRNSDGNIRIHLQSTKAICRNRSLISTTDSLKLYEDQIVIKNPILKEIDEASLQKRPLSLCFDLGSSSEEVNHIDRSSTLSSVSSSSSSSNSKYYDSATGDWDYDQFLEDELDKGNKSDLRSENLDADSDSFSCLSSECSSKDSVITVIAKKACNCRLTEIEQLNTDNPFNCDCNGSFRSTEVLSNRKPLSEQSYDLSSPDDLDFNKIEILDNEVLSNNNKYLEYEIPAKEIQEIIRIFNSNSVGMRIFEDNSRSLICTVKIFINLSEPVRMGCHTHVHNHCIISDKTLFPRGGFELVDIDRSTTCKDIIEHLFEKFHIQENYCNYGLFEHTAKLKEKDYLKRFGYEFSIFSHLINMVRIENHNFATHFHCKRFVLQENEKTPINWSSFSISELSNFLRILEKEEKERKQKILDFYSELGNMIESQMKLILP